MEFEKVWNDYYQRLYVFCRQSYHLPEEDTEDIVQEILLKVYKNMNRYSGKYSFSTWIYTIARNTCIDFLRRTGGENTIDNGDDWIPTFQDTKNPGPEDAAIDNELHSAIEAFIMDLPRDDRELVYLKMNEDLPYKEVARITGKPVGTLKYRFHSIRKQLQEYLGFQNNIGEIHETAQVYN